MKNFTQSIDFVFSLAETFSVCAKMLNGNAEIEQLNAIPCGIVVFVVHSFI